MGVGIGCYCGLGLIGLWFWVAGLRGWWVGGVELLDKLVYPVGLQVRVCFPLCLWVV